MSTVKGGFILQKKRYQLILFWYYSDNFKFKLFPYQARVLFNQPPNACFSNFYNVSVVLYLSFIIYLFPCLKFDGRCLQQGRPTGPTPPLVSFLFFSVIILFFFLSLLIYLSVSFCLSSSFSLSFSVEESKLMQNEQNTR